RAGAIARSVLRRVVEEDRQLGDRLDHVAGCHELELVRGDRGNRSRRREAARADARARDRDFLAYVLLRGRYGVGEREPDGYGASASMNRFHFLTPSAYPMVGRTLLLMVMVLSTVMLPVK